MMNHYGLIPTNFSKFLWCLTLQFFMIKITIMPFFFKKMSCMTFDMIFPQLLKRTNLWFLMTTLQYNTHELLLILYVLIAILFHELYEFFYEKHQQHAIRFFF